MPPAAPPIACTLTAAEMPKRLAEMRAIGESALLSAETSDATARLRFRPGGAIRGRLQAVVEAEAKCCAFLHLNISEEEAEVVVLSICSPEGGKPIMNRLVAAFRGDDPLAA